jgi:D-glycero-D-manno-heptose 1,7-bisphosphate phosphatase
MVAQFGDKEIDIWDIFFFPHGPESTCKCRKPQPGMLLKARDKYGINMEYSWMIGDKESDIEAAMAAGISNTIIVKS